MPNRSVLAMKCVISGYEFVEVGQIRLDSDNEMPQSRYARCGQVPLHRYGRGPFCRFSVAKGWKKAGVYTLDVDGDKLYVGECQNLEERWGPRGYGTIQPRNCFEGGQQTNCRINNLILLSIKGGARVTLWFLEAEAGKRRRKSIESGLVSDLNPPWNR